MSLLQRIALLSLQGKDRSAIAADLNMSERMVAWLMDSDSFQVVLEAAKVGA